MTRASLFTRSLDRIAADQQLNVLRAKADQINGTIARIEQTLAAADTARSDGKMDTAATLESQALAIADML